MKILLSIGMFLTSVLSGYPIGTNLPIVSNYAYMYEHPDFASDKYEFKITKGEEITLLDDEIVDDFYYACYKFENVTYNGYVFKDCVSTLTTSQDVILSYNGKIAVDTKIYSIVDPSQVLLSDGEEVILKENTEVYIYSGYDRKSEFTAIKFSYNGKIEVGYVKTANITPYGVSPILIVSLTAIIASVGVILILLGISKKRLKISPVKEK